MSITDNYLRVYIIVRTNEGLGREDIVKLTSSLSTARSVLTSHRNDDYAYRAGHRYELYEAITSPWQHIDYHSDKEKVRN